MEIDEARFVINKRTVAENMNINFYERITEGIRKFILFQGLIFLRMNYITSHQFYLNIVSSFKYQYYKFLVHPLKICGTPHKRFKYFKTLWLYYFC